MAQNGWDPSDKVKRPLALIDMYNFRRMIGMRVFCLRELETLPVLPPARQPSNLTEDAGNQSSEPKDFLFN